MVAPLIAKLERRDRLGPAERSSLAGALSPPRKAAAGVDLIQEHARPTSSLLILEGFCARYTVVENGGRQISQIGVPGDFLDLHGFLMKQMDHGVVALTPVLIAEVAHSSLRRLTDDHPHLMRLFWLDTLVDAATHRQWLVGLGRRNARGRLAHLICELYLRLEASGNARDEAMTFPLSQAVLADVLALTPVHVSRVVKELRDDQLIEWSGGTVRILDRLRLWAEAEFDPGYLRLDRSPV